MRDQEKLLLVLLKQLNEQDFEILIDHSDVQAQAMLFAKLLGKDERWSLVKPLLDKKIESLNEAIPYFEQRKSEAWESLSLAMASSVTSLPWYRNIAVQHLRIAAAVALVCMAGFFCYNNYVPDRYSKSYPLVKMWKSSERGSDLILLPDSSRVWLNANSSVAYIQNSSPGLRQVKLSGEAYFEVKSSKEKPFEVMTDQGAIRVTGTHFFAGKAAADSLFYVELLEGKVSFQTYGFRPRACEMKPKQSLFYRRESGKVEIRPILNSKHLWLRKTIECEKTPLPELLKQMEIWYGVEIRLAERSLERLHFSGTIDPEVSLQRNLDKLSWTSNFKYVMNNKQYLIKNNE